MVHLTWQDDHYRVAPEGGALLAGFGGHWSSTPWEETGLPPSLAGAAVNLLAADGHDVLVAGRSQDHGERPPLRSDELATDEPLFVVPHNDSPFFVG